MIFTLGGRLSVKRQWPHQTSLFGLHGPVMIGGNEYDNNYDLVNKICFMGLDTLGPRHYPSRTHTFLCAICGWTA